MAASACRRAQRRARTRRPPSLGRKENTRGPAAAASSSFGALGRSQQAEAAA